MASLLRFTIDPVALQDAIQAKQDSAESTRRLHFIAARKIQTWYRGAVTRRHLRELHENATTLQRHWRGYRARTFAKRYLTERVRQMWQDHYDGMATKIQAVWRGYWVRKTRMNFLQFRLWLKAVYEKNDETLDNMRRFRQEQLERAESATENESMLWILFILFKLHHLLRTKCRPGVITRIDKTRFTYIEEMLRCLEYERYTPKTKSVCRGCRIDREPSFIFRGTYFERCEKELREFERSLRAGNVPVFRSEPFEEDDRTVVGNERFDRRLKRKYSGRCLHQRSRVQPIELYEAISKMDCQLGHFRLRCPIHNLIF